MLFFRSQERVSCCPARVSRESANVHSGICAMYSLVTPQNYAAVANACGNKGKREIPFPSCNYTGLVRNFDRTFDRIFSNVLLRRSFSVFFLRCDFHVYFSAILSTLFAIFFIYFTLLAIFLIFA